MISIMPIKNSVHMINLATMADTLKLKICSPKIYNSNRSIERNLNNAERIKTRPIIILIIWKAILLRCMQINYKGSQSTVFVIPKVVSSESNASQVFFGSLPSPVSVKVVSIPITSCRQLHLYSFLQEYVNMQSSIKNNAEINFFIPYLFASCPQAASISFPRLLRTFATTP